MILQFQAGRNILIIYDGDHFAFVRSDENKNLQGL